MASRKSGRSTAPSFHTPGYASINPLDLRTPDSRITGRTLGDDGLRVTGAQAVVDSTRFDLPSYWLLTTDYCCPWKRPGRTRSPHPLRYTERHCAVPEAAGAASRRTCACGLRPRGEGRRSRGRRPRSRVKPRAQGLTPAAKAFWIAGAASDDPRSEMVLAVVPSDRDVEQVTSDVRFFLGGLEGASADELEHIVLPFPSQEVDPVPRPRAAPAHRLRPRPGAARHGHRPGPRRRGVGHRRCCRA